jgi:phospholipase/lecithinase/hemolysin
MWKFIILLAGGVLTPPVGAFTSLHVFGDSVSSVTYGLVDSQQFYHGRSCNGRLWTEVLAQRQGLAFETNKTTAFFGHYSNLLVTNAANYPTPADASNALVVVWVNNADFVGMTFDSTTPYVSNAPTLTFWTNRIRQSLANHSNIIQTFYGKGVRTLLMPNAVDIGKTPYFNGTDAGSRAFLRQRILEYNLAFAGVLSQAQTNLPGLTIRSPNLFALLDNIVSNAAAYGLTNALEGGIMVDALTDFFPTTPTFNGPATNHIFWDYLNPGAKAQSVLADLAHQSLTPSRLTSCVPGPGSNRLDAVQLPVGGTAHVEGTTNFLNWTDIASATLTNAAQSLFVPPAGPRQFYRLRFPHTWAWP